MKLVKADLGEKHPNESITILGLSDLHIGNPAHNPVVAQRIVDWVKERKSRYVLLLGDLTETALRDSYGEIYEQPLSPQKQAEAVVHLLTPIKDRLLGCVSGNHEQRVTQRTSFDPAMIYASALGVPYDPASMVVSIKWAATRAGVSTSSNGGGTYYSIYFTHGWGAARTLGPRLSQPARLRDVVENADVYMTAHLHQPGFFPLDTFHIDLVHDQIVRRQSYYVTLGSSLDHAEYAEKKGLAPTTMEFPKVELMPLAHHERGGGNTKRIVVHSA